MTKRKSPARKSAEFQLHVEKWKRAIRAQADQVPLRESQVVKAVLDFANAPEQPHGPSELIQRTAGWLASMIELRRQPKRFAEFKRSAFASWSPMAREVDVTPVFEIDRNRITVSQVVDGGSQPAMLAYGLLLLLDEARGYGLRLCRCRKCRTFFLRTVRKRAGRPETLYCSPEHRLEGEREVGRNRQAEYRKRNGGDNS